MLPARHLAALADKPGSGEREHEIVALARELEAEWRQMIPRINANKEKRGEDSEELTLEEQQHVTESEEANEQLDAELDGLIKEADTAVEIVELMLPLYEDEIRFWQEITADPKNIHPEDKRVIDEILTRQQVLVGLLAEYTADAS